MNSLDQIVNLKVKVTTLLDQSITATVFAFSPSQEILALKVESNNGGKNGSPKPEVFKIVNTAFIKSLQVLPPFPKKGQKVSNKDGNQKFSKVDIKRLELDLNQAIAHYSTPVEPEVPKVTKKNEASPLASKIFKKLSLKFGKENVRWHGNESIIIFKEIIVSRPYALNKISNLKKTLNSKQIEDVRNTLREIWLEVDNSKRGG